MTMTRHTKQWVVCLLGFSLFDLFAIGREDGIKFGSVRRGRERLDRIKTSYHHWKEWLNDRGRVWDFRLSLSAATLVIGTTETIKHLGVALQSHPDDNNDRPAGWRRVSTSVPSSEQAVAANAVKLAKPKRKKVEKRVPSDRILNKKTTNELVELGRAAGLQINNVNAGKPGERESILKRLKAKRKRQEKAAQASTKVSIHLDIPAPATLKTEDLAPDYVPDHVPAGETQVTNYLPNNGEPATMLNREEPVIINEVAGQLGQ